MLSWGYHCIKKLQNLYKSNKKLRYIVDEVTQENKCFTLDLKRSFITKFCQKVM